MKKALRILALAMVLATLSLTLLSCAPTLSGTYAAEGILSEGSFAFNGSKVTYTSKLLGKAQSYEGKYSINEDAGTITFTFDDEDCPFENGSYDFTQDKEADTVKIGLVTYTKQ